MRQRRRSALEWLEARTLLAVLPVPQATTFVENAIPRSGGNVSSPTVVVDRYNPYHLVSVWTRNDPDLAPGNITRVEGAYSNDGGLTWTPVGTAAAPSVRTDPTIKPGPGINTSYTQTLNPQVAFDNDHNVYVLVQQSNGSNSSGALVLRKFHFPGTGSGVGTPTQVGGDIVVRQYVTDPVFNPTLTVDDTLEFFQDPDTGAVQTNPHAGNVWVGWSTSEVRPTGVFDNVGQSWNANSIQVVTSSDGGQTFSGATQANNQSRWTGPTGVFANATPKVVVGQGKAGPANQAAANAGGGAVVIWDNFGRYGATAGNPGDVPDLIQSNAVGGGYSYTMPGAIGGIANATGTAAPFGAQVTDFTIPVAFAPGAAFNALTKLTVNMTLQQENMAWLRAELIAPDGRSVLLFSNAQGTDGVAPPADRNTGVIGKNLGIVGAFNRNETAYGFVGSTFDEAAARSINDRSGGGVGYTGTFRTEGQRSGTNSSLARFNGSSASDLTGDWTLRFTAYGNNGTSDTALISTLRNLSLTFTDGVVAEGGAETVATTQVRGSQSGVYPRISFAAGVQGIGPGIDAAQDNTLGSFSPHQGRIYVTYTGYQTGPFDGIANPGDNTDVYLAYSDDGGANWTRRGIVNDDDGAVDGFSGANSDPLRGPVAGRAQFLPQVVVDQSTGSLVMSWRDGRDDPARTRTSVYVTASIDGGVSFSQQSHANPAQSAFDPITRRTIALNPAGDNLTLSEPVPGAFGYGMQMGLTVGSGQVYLAWAGNLNKSHLNSSNAIFGDALRTYVARMTIAAGPRIIDGTQGVVDTRNGVAVDSFIVEFDRPIDAPGYNASFTPDDVMIYFRGTSNSDPYIAISATGVTPIASSLVPGIGYTRFQVTFPTQTAVGTYSYIINPDISDRIRGMPLGIGGPTKTGSRMDQDANGVAGQDPLNFTSNGLFQGYTPGDVFSTPYLARVMQTWSNVAGGPSVAGSLVAQILGSRVVTTSLPLILPGSHVIGSNAQNGTGSLDNLVLNNSTNHLSTTFDRPIRTATFTPADVLRIMGPTGSLTGRQYFPSNLSGQQIPAPASATVPGVLESALTVPAYFGSSFVASDLTVTLSATFPNLAGLRIELVAPDNTIVPLVPTGGLRGADLTNTVFDDAATRSITNGSAPYTGSFRPAGGSLAGLVGKSIQGTWRLRITNTATRTVGVLTGWALGATPTISVTPIAPTTVNGHQVASTFRIGFPTQVLSGTYTIQLGSDITDVNGQKLDRNLNAGLDVRRGDADNVPVTSVNVGSGVVNQPLMGGTLASTVQVSDNFIVQGTTTTSGISGLRLLLTLSSPDVSRLRATLTHNGVSVVLFANLIQGTNAGGFTNVIFDDTATTPITQASPPYIGASFNPQLPLLNGGFEGATSAGDWVLTIEGTEPGASAVLSSWSLLFQKPLPTSGLGEPVADQTSLSFRIFQTELSNNLSHNTWTSVGAASTLTGSDFGSAGQVTALAQDPSDPTGNTFYVGGANGGVWKTTNFLTTDPQGPTYIPLTDFGPTSGLNISAITVFPRNNDPRQSIVIAATGDGGLGTPGLGFLMSRDGGATWKLLDSTTNVDASGQPLPLTSPLRDHRFVGAQVYKVVVDPKLTLQNQVIIYAAVSGPNGGLWRSTDTGDHWTLMKEGQATDVVLDPSSNTGGGDDPNLLRLYAGFVGQGVFLSPNRGQNWNPLNGNVGNPLLIDVYDNSPVTVATIGPGPMAATGRVVLGKPALTGNHNQDLLFAGWLYAAVADGSGNLTGLFMTKDFGQNWVNVRFPNGPRGNGVAYANPDNNVGLLANYDFSTSTLSLDVDPANPNIVYLGGAHKTSTSAIMRLDVTKIWDAYNLTLYSAVSTDGQTDWWSNGPVVQGDRLASRPSTVVPPVANPPGYLNYIRDPNNPFVAGATRFVNNLNHFTNNGAGVTWTPFDPPIDAGRSATYQRLVTLVDPTTGMTRLVYGGSRGVWTVLDDDGKMLVGESVGTTPTPGANRNGNLALAQYYYGAVQPSASALASNVNYDRALFYASSNDQAQYSNGGILDNGNLNWSPTRFPAFPPVLEGIYSGGVAVDPQGSGELYQAFQAGTMPWNLETTFFRVNHIGRTFGLIPVAGDLSQWNATSGATFAVNPLSGQQLIISSANGRIYSTTDQGRTWFEIGTPGTFGNPNGYSKALAYGAPQPGATVGDLGNFLYVGTLGGRIFMSQTGGGGQGNEWNEISTGLDGSAIQRIIPSTVRGQRSAYAVTAEGVYYMADSAATDAEWISVTGNLREQSISIFGESYTLADGDPLRQTLALSAMTIDWRYSIPNSSEDPTGAGRHPVLYVAGNAGVFRSIDNGITWTAFPNQDVDGAQLQGGLFPRALVTDLDLALGAINPDTGVPNLKGTLDPYNPNSPNDPNLLYATTWGRGAFAIRIAPLILPGTTRVNPADISGTAPDGTPIIQKASFGISGLSMMTGFNNATRITIFSVTDNKVVGGFNINDVAGTNVRANWTDINGNFNIQIPEDAFTTNGTKVLRIQATDDTGSVGNEITLTITLDANLQPPTVPVAPSLDLRASDNTGLVKSENYTNHSIPSMVGETSRNVSVRLFYSRDGVTWLPTQSTTSSATGAFTIPLADINGVALGDGTYRVSAVATNSHGNSPVSPIVTVRIKTAPPTAAPTLKLDPSYDSGIVGDGITNVRRPVFTGTVGAVNAGSTIRVYRSEGGSPSGPILAEVRADAQGNFAVQLPLSLNNGVITLTATAIDAAGNTAPGSASPLGITIITTALDYSGSARDRGYPLPLSTSQGTLFSRNTTANAGQWFGRATPPLTLSTWYTSGVQVGQSTDIPLVGDFDADGKQDLATFSTSTLRWTVAMSGGGRLSFSFGVNASSIPLTGNFDGAGASQYGLFDIVNGVGVWRMTSTAGDLQKFDFGIAGDVPLTGDFLGRGYDQAAVYRPNTGQFLVYDKATGTSDVIAVLPANQIPVPGYYENLAQRRLGQAYRMTPAVFNPATGVFTIDRMPSSEYPRTSVFKAGDIPVPGDYGGVGWDFPAIYRPSTGEFLLKRYQKDPNSIDAGITSYTGAARTAVVPVGAPLAYRQLSASDLRNGVSPLSTRGFGSGMALAAQFAAEAPIQPPVALAAAPSGSGEVVEGGHGVVSQTPSLTVSESSPAGARRPLFTGTAAPGASVALSLGGEGLRGMRRVGTATADAAGSYSFQLPAGLRIGKYTLVSSVEGADGSMTPVASTSFQIKPTPRLRTPVLGRFARTAAPATRAAAPIAAARAVAASVATTPPVVAVQAVDPVSTAIDSLDGGLLRGMRRKPS